MLILVMKQETIQRRKSGKKKVIFNTYNEYKEFEGRKYTGMKVERIYQWYYENVSGEKKIIPDQWDFTFSVDNRSAGNAPEGSGVAVGIEYHWYIVAHQIVKKADVNKYTTTMTGIKYKLAHKRAEQEN